MFFPRLPLATNLPKLLRQLERDLEAVINVLQPGPLGIIEHRFTAEEVRKAKATAEQAINNWKMNDSLGNNSQFKKHEANQASGYKMLKIKTPKTLKAKRALDKRAPKLVENAKKTLILHGTKTSNVLNAVLAQIFHLKKGLAVKFSRKNENIRPFESSGETSLEFFSLKTDCSIFVFGSHSKKRPNNLILGRMYDHHIYDLVEVGVENFKPIESFKDEKKMAPRQGSKPFFAFIGESFESVDELKHLKEVLLDHFRGEVVENLNLTGVDRVFVCTAISATTVLFKHCAIRLKKSGTSIPRVELVEVGPSMDLVVRRHRLPNEGVKKQAMKAAPTQPKKIKNVSRDEIQGKIGKIYIPDQQVGGLALSNNIKGLKRERREGKVKKDKRDDQSKKMKIES